MGKKDKAGFLNPMDKLRKDSRKRELKKNKKQRLIAQTTLMKIRDPYEIISALDRLDRVEFDPYNEPVLGEKVLETKRQKLMASWSKLMAFHKNEPNKERYEELKKIQANYNNKRDALMIQYKAIRSTEDVDIDAIPLPSIPPPIPSMSSSFTSPFMNANFKMPVNRKPPGCPQGLPPRIDELDIDDVESSEDESVQEKKEENNLTEFLKEIELIAGDKVEEADKENDGSNENGNEDGDKKENPVISSLPPIQAAPPILTVNPAPNVHSDHEDRDRNIDEDGKRDIDEDDDKEEKGDRNEDNDKDNHEDEDGGIDKHSFSTGQIPPLKPTPPLQSSLPLTLPPALPPPLPTSFLPTLPNLSLRPPVLAPQLRPLSGQRPHHHHGNNPRLNHPRYQHTQRLPLPFGADHKKMPDFRQPGERQKPSETKTTTIEAKPQLRNLAQDSTRFLPAALRNKAKQPTGMKKPFTSTITPMMKPLPETPETTASPASNSKDAAYEDFMKEMQGLM